MTLAWDRVEEEDGTARGRSCRKKGESRRPSVRINWRDEDGALFSSRGALGEEEESRGLRRKGEGRGSNEGNHIEHRKR